MIKIEDIFDCHIENWKVYDTLLKKNFFVPVVGAGLSAGIGVGDWNRLIIALAKKVFAFWDKKTIEEIEKKLSETEGNLDKIVQEMDVLLQECNEKCRTLIQESLDGLKKIDEKDRRRPEQKAAHVQDRITLINAFFQEGKREGDFVKVGYAFFYKLLNREAYFSTYEAAELLKVVNKDDQYLMSHLYEVINQNKQSEKWEIEEDKAVYWLAEILIILKESEENQNRANIVDCFTTNYDDIIESACLMTSDMGVKVEHLHGKFDSQGNPIHICLTLSDLLEEYQSKLNEAKTSISGNRGIGLMERGNSDIPFLFLGTSFSENHIGRLVISGTSYGISPFPNVEEKIMYLERMEKFGIGNDAAICYPVNSWNHEALVVLLHQLARDLRKKFWNDWTCMDILVNPSEPITELETHMIEEAVLWLKNFNENTVLYVGEGEKCEFISVEQKLVFCRSGIIYNICKKLKEEFMRPQWSMYWETDKFEYEKEDTEPLGDTLYIYLKVNESEEDWEKFKRQIEKWYSEPQKNGWKYKIVRFKLSRGEKIGIDSKRWKQNEAIGKKDSLMYPVYHIDRKTQMEGVLELLIQVWESTYKCVREYEKLITTEYGLLVPGQFYNVYQEILSELGKFDRQIQEAPTRMKGLKEDDISEDYLNNYSFEDNLSEVNKENDLTRTRGK